MPDDSVLLMIGIGIKKMVIVSASSDSYTCPLTHKSLAQQGKNIPGVESIVDISEDISYTLSSARVTNLVFIRSSSHSLRVIAEYV